MKLLWHSVPPWNYTGYGVQTFHWVNILKALGHDVKVLSNCQMFYAPALVWGGIEVLPVGYQAWGVQNVLACVDGWKPDAVISLMDAWVLPDDFGADIKGRGSRWYPYAPVDHCPISQSVVNRMVLSEAPIAMSKFGLEEFTKSGLMNAMYWPHGVSTRSYHPMDNKDVIVAKDRFAVGMVASNTGVFDRKAFLQNMQGYKLFHDTHPDSMLYIHTNPLDHSGMNQNLIELSALTQVEFDFPPLWSLEIGYTPTQMAELYNSFDVLLHCSRGEGFGVSLIEAQACGVPVITTDFTSMTELGQKGWLVPVAYKEPTAANSWMAIPSVQGIADSLTEAYELWKEGGSGWEQKKYNALTFAQQYDFRIITEQYVLPILEKMS